MAAAIAMALAIAAAPATAAKASRGGHPPVKPPSVVAHAAGHKIG